MSIYRLKGASGAVINQSYTLTERTVIGRADDCDLRLDQPGVSPRHAEVALESGGRLRLTALAPGAEVLLNGEAVEEASLAGGDEIRIANCRFVVQAPGLRPEKVLTAEATRTRRGYLLWFIVGGLLAAAAGAWYAGLLSFV